MQITEVLDYTGGMNTMRAPHLINKQEAVELINVDLRLGSLQSMPNLQRIQELSGSHFTQFADNIYSYPNWRSNAYMDNKLYWANGVDTGKVLPDGTELALGLPTPISPMLLTASVDEGPHTGDFKYTYTFYDIDTGVESAPAPLPPYITVDKKSISGASLAPLPEGADRYRIYRIGGYLPRFTMVFELRESDLPFTDESDDTQIDGRLLTTLRCTPPPDGINFFTHLNGRIFGAVDTRLYFSALGNADAWYASDYFIMPSTITAVASAPAGLLVMGENWVYLLQGASPESFRLKVLSDELGCVAAESVAYVRENAIWVSGTSICMADGYRVINLTADKIDTIKDINPTSACVLNDVYYVSYRPGLYPRDTLFPYDELYPSAVIGTGDIEEGVIAIDFKRGNGYSYKIIEYDSVISIGIYNGGIYMVSGAVDLVFLPCNAVLDCDGFLFCSQYSLNLMNIYGSQGFAELTYISPQFIDQSFSTLKEYDKVRINFQGVFTVEVLFDNQESIVIAQIDNTNSDENIALIGIPNSNNKSHSIGFKVVGRGILRSIQYSWKPRELV